MFPDEWQSQQEKIERAERIKSRAKDWDDFENGRGRWAPPTSFWDIFGYRPRLCPDLPPASPSEIEWARKILTAHTDKD